MVSNVSPVPTLSPTFTATDSTLPAEGAGISRDALSDSSTTMTCSASRLSPTATFTSMISAESISPRSGTVTVSLPPLPCAFGVSGASVSGGVDSGSVLFSVVDDSSRVASDSAEEAFSDSPSASTSIRSSPSLTRSPTLTLMAVIFPACGAGTSTVALSDSRTIMVSSAAMVSPTFTLISMTSTGSLLPTSGTRIMVLLTPVSFYEITLGCDQCITG